MPKQQVAEKQTILISTPPIDMNGPERIYPLFCAIDGDYVFVNAYVHWIKIPGAGLAGYPTILLGTHNDNNKFGAFNIVSTFPVVGIGIKSIRNKIAEGEILYLTKPKMPVNEDHGLAAFFFALRRVT